MVATVINICAWIGCAILAFLLLKDFISVERQSKELEEKESTKRGEH